MQKKKKETDGEKKNKLGRRGGLGGRRSWLGPGLIWLGLSPCAGVWVQLELGFKLTRDQSLDVRADHGRDRYWVVELCVSVYNEQKRKSK